MNAMEWNDLGKDPAPQWVGDIAMGEVLECSSQGVRYYPALWSKHGQEFKALCRRIYKHETPPVDPDFERMTQTIAAYELFCGNEFLAKCISQGKKGESVQAALDAWNETVAS